MEEERSADFSKRFLIVNKRGQNVNKRVNEGGPYIFYLVQSCTNLYKVVQNRCETKVRTGKEGCPTAGTAPTRAWAQQMGEAAAQIFFILARDYGEGG